MQPLDNIKILDLSRVYAGPGGTMILGDLGAEVIRIESPEGTDSMRDWVPFVGEESTYYLCANRNKKSITLNLKDPEGKKLFFKMVKEADVILENFKTGTLERLGLGYDTLKSIKQELILCSVTGYGHTGPYKNEPGFDPVIQAIGGLMDVTGSPDGEPTRVGLPLIDIMTSQYVAISILSAIRLKDRTGVGQRIELSLLDVQISSLANVASSFLNAGKVSKRMGNSHSYIVPYQVFQCIDRPLMVSAGNDRLFKQLCIALNQSEWAEAEKYATNEKRVANRDELTKKIQSVFYENTADSWFKVLSKNGVPSGPVNNIEQVFDHPQVKAREAIEEVSHPTLGTIKLVKSPIRFSTLNVQTKAHPPILGEHTEQYLTTELGLNKEEIYRLKVNGVI
ncbi:CaiB/BaiF CoA-transferase family protein [Cytobacillus horneckiae]|uniref:CaiB/BaiF CoA transferase family protein n=1 Tax=Cytobacillus horneckiae TaxID=549687 RepID=UPI00203A6F7D|nr:CaiB/BaiF CoA-transferase family protein [Cytobacillus horneckiae]MCM3177911.1 CoA transferase [Cytobacillus horneckiae]